MNIRLISNSEINQRQQDVRNGAYHARHSFTIAGLRRLFGNTFIALGTSMLGLGEGRRQTLIANPAVLPAHSL